MKLDDAAYSAELEFLLELTPPERGLLLMEEAIKNESGHMNNIVGNIKRTGWDITHSERMAKRYIEDYNEQNTEANLIAVEQYVQLVESYKGYKKWLLTELKEAREYRRWLMKKYQAMKGQPKN